MCRAGELQQSKTRWVWGWSQSVAKCHPDSNHKDLVKGKGVSVKCSGDQSEEWDWRRLGSL